jgi:pimeloyl-ACP methyl ester carboxylesterase
MMKDLLLSFSIKGSSMEIQHLMTDISDLQIHTLKAGTGPETVILLHGGGIDSAWLSWELLIPELAGKYRVLAPDWPGYGKSSQPDQPYQLADCARLLEGLLDAWGVEKAALVGISLGGGIAIDFALANPDRVERLVLVDSYGLQDRTPLHQLGYMYVNFPFALEMTWASMKSRAITRWALKSLFFNDERVTPDIVDQVYAEIKKPGAGKAFAAIQKHDITWTGLRSCFMDRLHEITAPTLIIHGDHDSLVPIDCSRQAHQKIKGSQLQILKNCGHWPQRDCPDEFNQAVKQFLIPSEAFK